MHTPEACRFDLLGLKDNVHTKIQVKTTNTTYIHHGSEWMAWDIKKKPANKKKYRAYSEEEVDIFAFVCLFLKKVHFVANRDLGRRVKMRVETFDELDQGVALNEAYESLNGL